MWFIKTSKRKNYLYLLQQFTITDFKLRYSHSTLGYIWSLLNPLLMFGVLYIVFSIFMRFGAIEHYRIYLLSGILLWTFFADSSTSGMTSLLSKSSLLSKIYFQRMIIPLSAILTNTLTLFINMFVLVFFIIISKIQVRYTAFFSIFFLIELIILSLGASFILSSLYLKFRDLSHLWTVFLQLGFWATPIIYPIEIVPEKYHILFKINPMSVIIQNFRLVVIYGMTPDKMTVIYNSLIVIILFILGLFLFNKQEKYFAEWI